MERQTFGKVPMKGQGERAGLSPALQETSAVRSQLRLNVHPANGTLLVGREPLVDTRLMEEVHAGQSPEKKRKYIWH